MTDTPTPPDTRRPPTVRPPSSGGGPRIPLDVAKPPNRKQLIPWLLAVALAVGLGSEVTLDVAGGMLPATACEPTGCPTADPRPYCERHPSRCSECPLGFGQCGEPVEWICCDGEGAGGCVGVALATDCPAGHDIVGSCEWGQTTRGRDGVPTVECFD